MGGTALLQITRYPNALAQSISETSEKKKIGNKYTRFQIVSLFDFSKQAEEKNANKKS